MDDLPGEMLEQVFSNLQNEDLKNARLVSKRWRQISYAYPIQKRVITVIRNYRDMIPFYTSSTAFCDQFKPVNMILEIRSLDIQNSSDIDENKKFWELRGSSMRSLAIIFSAKHCHVLIDILKECPNLETLEVRSDNIVKDYKIFESLSFDNVTFDRLLNLTVCGCYYLLFPLIVRAIVNAKFLEYVKYDCSGGLCLEGNRHPPLHRDIEFTKKLNLKKMYFLCSHVDDIFMDNLTRSLGSKLESISIEECESLSNLTLRRLEERCTNLKLLIIGRWPDFTFNAGELFFKLKNLTAVTIYSNNNIYNEEVASLGDLPLLACLRIAFCHNITEEGICQIFKNKIKSSIQELRLEQFFITDRLVTEIAPLLPNLKILNLGFCERLTSASLQAVANNNHLLQCFTIIASFDSDSLVMLSFDEEVPPCINRMTNLIHFSCFNSDDLTNTLRARIQLPHLKVLDSDTTLSLFQVSLRNPSLQFINNYCCETTSFIYDSFVLFLRRKKYLKCYESPFGICNNVRY